VPESDERSDTDEPVPKLPRGRGIKLGTAELFRIAITIAFLVAVIMLTKPCSQAVSTFVVGFGSGSGSGSGTGTGTGTGSGSAKIDPYERLTPNMTEQQVKDAIERSKAKNAALAGSGASPRSGSASGAGCGSATGSGSGSGAGSGAGSGSSSNAPAPAMSPAMRRPAPAPAPAPPANP
jgi:hypothetical protein